jgi:hypothetical protein
MPRVGYSYFGPFYEGYENRPREAIRLLRRVKQGECPQALFRDDIGYVDIVWCENDPKTNKGFGLKHIIEKHGKDIKALGYEVENFIPIVFEYGEFNKKKLHKNKLFIEGKNYRIVILTKWNGKQKKLLLTAFDINKKRPQKAVLKERNK